MLSKTAFNRMKKAELVEHCLAAQQKMCRDALFASEEDEVDAQAVQSITLSTVIKQRDELRAVNKKLVKDIKELSEAKDKLNSAWAKKRDEIYSDHRKEIKEIKKEKMSCEFKKLKATIEELKDENEELNSELHDLTVENEEFRTEIDGHEIDGHDVCEKNDKLFKFIIGGGSSCDVEEIVREKMSEEFIDGNREWWDQIELFL